MNSSFAETFINRVLQNELPEVAKNAPFTIKFLGTTSFLLDDGHTQILLDGFLTRARHRYIHPFGPIEDHIQAAISEAGICKHPSKQWEKDNPTTCKTHKGRGLQIIIPAHGHYDHALDAPYLAAWSGATLIADESVHKILDASEAYEKLLSPSLDWNLARKKTQYPFKDKQKTISKWRKGKFHITLIRSKHGLNPTTSLVSGITKTFSFPTHATTLKEGTVLTVLIQYGTRKLLFVASPGAYGSLLEDIHLDADTVFLSIGALGLQWRRDRRTLWNEVVKGVGATQVILTHWDDDQKLFDKTKDQNFPVGVFHRPSASLKVFDLLAKRDGINIRFAPAFRSFIP